MDELEEKLLKLEIDEKERDLKDRDKPRSAASRVNDFLKTASSVIALIAGSIALWQQMENSQKQTEIKNSQISITSTQQRLDKTQSEIEAQQKLLDRNALFYWENREIEKLNYPKFDIPIEVVGLTDNRLHSWNRYATCLAYYKNESKAGLYPTHISAADYTDFLNTSREARQGCLVYLQEQKTDN
ncbi:hypothetical protein [Kordiimonas laminariae]|uniref:hypothetical protein n=1 Tax=Kordiimonas laminariae TaxID=2917717 RepID=UPI001FF69652|nr:hypothetical protein [Kordiimonas laminariae]MCK0069651.1 hypothetical protein [Kordiimonas laminariae]